MEAQSSKQPVIEAADKLVPQLDAIIGRKLTVPEVGQVLDAVRAGHSVVDQNSSETTP